MRKIIKLTESDIHRIVKTVLEQEENNQQDEWVKVTPQEYLDIMKYASYNAKGVSNLPKFRGKKIWITGDLNVSRTPTKTLDGIGYVEGDLDISNTDIVDISFINVKGRVRDWDSGKSRLEAKRIYQAKLADANERREEKEWDLNNPDIDEVGIYAHAVLKYINDNENVEVRTEEDDNRLRELKGILENLQEKESQYEEEGKDLTDVYADIEATEEEIEEIENKIDVYNIVPKKYNHYDMPSFEAIGNDDLNGYEFAVGNEREVEESAKDALQSQIDEGITNFFNESFLESHLDEEQVLDTFREHYEYDIWENPESYFDEDDYELTPEQEKRLSEIEIEIEDYEKEQNELDPDDENYDEYYDDFQNHIDKLEEEREDIVPDNTPTQDMVDDKVDDILRDVRRNMVSYMKDFGMEIENYVDTDSLIQDVIDSDGYGSILNTYDGTYDTYDINGETLYVMRIS